MKTVVCRADELAPGQFTPADLGSIRVVVIRASDGTLSALAAKCLHQGGPLDKGRLYQHTESSSGVGEYAMDPEREVLKCPWHGYEYDVHDGRTVFDGKRCLQTFAVTEEDGQITVEPMIGGARGAVATNGADASPVAPEEPEEPEEPERESRSEVADADAVFVDVCGEDDLADGDKIAFDVDGERRLLARVDGRFYAIGAVCTHERAFLDEGMLSDGVVYCPLHYSAFDVRDGSVLGPPADRPEPSYPTRVIDGVVQVSLAPGDGKSPGGDGQGGSDGSGSDAPATTEWPLVQRLSVHERVLQRIDASSALDTSSQKLGSIARPVRSRLAPTGLLDLLHGRWTGHALHPALSDLPIGLWVGAFVLFLAEQPTAAFILSVVGTVSGVAAAVTGVNDVTVADGHERRIGVLHGMMMTVALLVEAGAALSYGLGSTVTATVLTGVGLVVTIAAAYLGGHLVLARGTMVNHAVRPVRTSGWHQAVLRADLSAGRTASAEVDGAPVLLYENGDGHVSAIEASCSHAGGPLSQGAVCDGVVSCPWHGSKFRLADGGVVRGPATFPQPALQVRQVDDWIEVRRVPPPSPRNGDG